MNQLIYKTSVRCDLTFVYPLPSSRFGEEDFSGIPLVMHTNGAICWDATDYILHRIKRNRTIAKSTLQTYANHLSRIIQYLDKYELNFSNLFDKNIFDLVKYLQDNKSSKTGKLAGNNQIISILSRLFDILMFLQDTGRIGKDVISSDLNHPAQINIEIKKYYAIEKRIINYSHHPACPRRQNSSKRYPISEKAIKALHDAIYSYASTEFIKMRWHCLLSVLEHTGAREEEVSLLKVSSVEECMRQINNSLTPRLAITTNKGANHGRTRLIPVPKEVVRELHNFIHKHRKEVVNKAKAKQHITTDNGYVFITTETAKRLTGKRIYDHFAEIRNSTNLEKREASPHMFRHRFITLHVKSRLKDLMASQGNYRSGLEDFVIKRVKRLTGHASDLSLWHYVDDALDEIQQFN